MNSQIQEGITQFKEDIQRNDPLVVARQMLMSNISYAFKQDEYHKLQTKISEHFYLHPSEVALVGSAKTGFSIAPSKRYSEFSNTSDIDIAIISSELFDEIWKSVYDFSMQGGIIWEKGDDFKKSLFSGWIRPDYLPPSKVFSKSDDWWKFFNDLTASRLFGSYKIRAGLYKSWYFLEEYHRRNIEDCKNEIKN
ncbi:MAG: hypothetical protein ABI778_10255 [Ignavibacteriota bacterium]